MTATTREALKPCPMCGCAATFVKHSAGVPGTQGFDKWDAVACKHCRTTVGACDRRFRNREDAAAAWNRRVPRPSQQAAAGETEGAGAVAVAPTIAEVLDWAASMATHEDPRTSDWYYDDPHELAKAIRKGPDEWRVMLGGTTQQTGKALLALSHQMDNEAQWITEHRVYDFATAIRVMLGLDGAEAVVAHHPTPVSAEEARALLSKAAIQLRLHNAHGNHRTDPAFIEDIERTAAGVSAEEALDAARLDWLERQDLNELVTMRRRTNGDVGVNVGRGPFFGKTLREALDAARGEERKAS